MSKLRYGFIVSIALALFLRLGPIKQPADLLAQDNAPRIIPLPELEDPHQICAENGRVYVVDKRNVIVYDLKDGRLLTRIGKLGQGPGEFTLGPGRLTVLSDRLVISDFRKIKFFTLDGEYSGEIREPGNLVFFPFLPIGKFFFGFPMELRDDGTRSPPSGLIYDKDLKPKKKFFGEFPMPPPPPPPRNKPPATKTDALLIRDYADYVAYGGEIYVADSRKGLSISVFAENGDLLYEIRHPVEKVKVPKSYLDAVIKERKASKYWNSIYAHQNLIVPDYFPDFVGFKIDGDRIYVIRPVQKAAYTKSSSWTSRAKSSIKVIDSRLSRISEFLRLSALTTMSKEIDLSGMLTTTPKRFLSFTSDERRIEFSFFLSDENSPSSDFESSPPSNINLFRSQALTRALF